jgi:hypothetical protein
MAVKPTFALAIPGESLRSRLPANARSLVSDTQFAGTTLDALIFPFSSGAVVTKRVLEKALSKVAAHGNALVVVGWDFTVEARAIIDGTKAVLLFHHEFGWTDAMWAEARQGYRRPAAEHDARPHAAAIFDADSLVVARDFLLNGMPWDLSRPYWMDAQRENIAQKVQADPMFGAKLREVALEALKSETASILRHGLTALAFVGTSADLPVIDGLRSHRDTSVSKDAGTCLYEVKKYVSRS